VCDKISPRPKFCGRGSQQVYALYFAVASSLVLVLLLTVVQKMHSMKKLTRESCWWRLRWFVTEGLTMKSKLSAALAAAGCALALGVGATKANVIFDTASDTSAR